MFIRDQPNRLAGNDIAELRTRGGRQHEASVTNKSLRTDLANAQQRVARMAAHNRQLERKLSELFGERAWRESGIGAAPDIDRLQRQVTALDQCNIASQQQLEEHDGELDVARAANRELISALNRSQ